MGYWVWGVGIFVVVAVVVFVGIRLTKIPKETISERGDYMDGGPGGNKAQ